MTIVSTVLAIVATVMGVYLTFSALQNHVITPKELKSIEAKIQILDSHEALIRSLQIDMQQDRREMEAKFNDQVNAIAMNENKIQKANETITAILKGLKTDANDFSEDLVALQRKSNANTNVLQKLQDDFDVQSDNITRMQKDAKTCLDEVESFQEKLKMHRDDLEEWKAKHKNITAEAKPMNCEDLSTTNISAKSGIYRIYPASEFSMSGLSVYCDMATRDGGWIVIQRRQDGSQDFYLGWQEYKSGFGKLNSEFWLGLDNIHALVSNGKWKLLINMRDDDKGEKYAMYKTFFVGPESGRFVLTIGDYSGDAGDSLTQHNGMKFTTKDNDNDLHKNNCAIISTGAWWYNHCHSSNLNGVYGRTGSKGPRWGTFTGQGPVEFVEMKIQRKK